MSRRPGIGQEAVRRGNMSALLTQVHLQGPTTRAALTTALGLNRSTIGDLTSQLEAMGLVASTRPEHGNGRIAEITPKGKALIAEMLRWK